MANVSVQAEAGLAADSLERLVGQIIHSGEDTILVRRFMYSPFFN